MVVALPIKLSEIGLSQGTFEKLSDFEFAEDISLESLSVGEMQEVIACARRFGIDIDITMSRVLPFMKRRNSSGGRKKGSKDKNPGSVARKIAGRRNAWRSGNGSHRTENDRLDFSRADVNQLKRKHYGILFKKALHGEHKELEENLCETFGDLYGLFQSILMGFLERGHVDIPIYALDQNGNVLTTEDGSSVVRALKTPRGSIDVFMFAAKCLGIDVAEWNLTAKSQDRQRVVSDEDILSEVERSMDELKYARERFSK